MATRAFNILPASIMTNTVCSSLMKCRTRGWSSSVPGCNKPASTPAKPTASPIPFDARDSAFSALSTKTHVLTRHTAVDMKNGGGVTRGGHTTFLPLPEASSRCTRV